MGRSRQSVAFTYSEISRADEKTSNMDPEQLDFDPEEDDETMLRLKALETQVFCLWKL